MKKTKKLISFIFVISLLAVNTAYAAPSINSTHIMQVINTEVNFTEEMFAENIDDLDGGAFTSIEITGIPVAASGVLESTSDTIDDGVVISVANISNLKFVPTADFLGTTSFTYKISNGTELSNQASFSIEYSDLPSNTPPTASDMTVEIEKNEQKTITLTASDENLDMLTYNIVTEPTNGTLDKTNIAEGRVVYTPTPEYISTDSFSFNVNDGVVDSNTATVTINIREQIPNTAPVTTDISVTTDEETAKSIQLIATDEDDDPLSYEITVEPTDGTLDKGGIATGQVVYTPNSGFIGSDSFKYKANDGKADSNIGTVTITVEEALNLPTFVYEDLKTHWVNYSAGHLADRGGIIGEKIGNKYFFYPEIKITRWEFMNYIIGALDLQTSTPNMELVSKFEDSQLLPDYINKIAAIATEAGFLSGVENDGKLYIRPYTYLTRAEAITLIGSLIAKEVESQDVLAFIDKNDIPDWAVRHITNMKNYGIIQGYDDNTIRPNNTLTKAQTIEMLYQTVKYNDNESAVFRMIKNRIS